MPARRGTAVERDDAASDAYFYIHFGVHARELRGGEHVRVLVEAAAVAVALV